MRAKMTLSVVVALGCCGSVAVADAVSAGPEAFYRLQSAEENEELTLRGLRMTVLGTEEFDHGELTWWEFTAVDVDGTRFGVRMLSERVPLMSPAPIGFVARYLYCDAQGRVFEYRDVDTDYALLPMLDFEMKFLPHPAYDARYPDRWATAGGFLGHTLIRVAPFGGLDPVSFENPQLLSLRSDLLMGVHATPCFDVDASRKGNDQYRWRPCNEDETRRLIEDGVNYFHVGRPEDAWLITQPVFFRAEPTFPDSFYRSNYYPGRMFIDEPSIRFGWNEHVPGHSLIGPEQLAEALRRRVAGHYKLADRRVPVGKVQGDLDLLYPNSASWDTHYFSAWQTLSAGAPALIFEGRYRNQGYGWHPTLHLGDEGLDGLTFDDQLHCMNAFMRGAARAFDGDWGVSVYHEGDPALFEPAFLKAYDMGARYLWFWPYMPDDGTGIDYETVSRLARAVRDHAAENPRGQRWQVNRAASVGIVLPPGYIYYPGTIMGFEQDQVSPAGATYGEISSAALWEGILCSRQGIDFDYINDEPFITELGYDRLVYVRPDGSLDPVPSWSETRPARGLRLRIEDSAEEPIAARMNRDADFAARSADGIHVDGELNDWPDDAWIPLPSNTHGDLVELETVVENVGAEQALKNNDLSYLGFKWKQLDTDLQRKYALEDFYIFGEEITDEAKPGIRVTKAGVVVTEVTPASPVDKAGIREGDVVMRIHQKRVNYEFQIHEALSWYRGMKELTFEITRSGRDRVGNRDDLRGDVALAIDDETLYFAARITDDVHSQAFWGWDFWRGDCVQLGLSPTLSQAIGAYGPEDHEIGFVLKDERPIAWRFQGRCGQPRAEIKTIRLQVKREGKLTAYEAAIPLEELLPIAPDLWPKAGFNVVVNDNDGQDVSQRKGRLELREGAMTRGKRPREFAVLAMAPSPDGGKISASLRWRRRATAQGGYFRLVLAACSPETRQAQVVANLQSLDSPQTPPAIANLKVPVAASPVEQSLIVETDSPPGRYSLSVQVKDAAGRVATHDRLAVYVYPPNP